MAKMFAVISVDGQRKIEDVCRLRANEMVRKGEAFFYTDRAALQLARERYPRRGLSATPNGDLIHRFLEAKNSNGDPSVIATMEADRLGWGKGRTV